MAPQDEQPSAPAEQEPHGEPGDEGLDDDWFPQNDGKDFDELTPHINWFRPVLMLGVIAFAIYLGTQFTEPISYFLSSTEPVELGEITEFPERTSANPDNPPTIPHNRFVHLSGIPTRLSISCTPPTRYFKLIGAHVYVALPMDEEMSTIACRAESERSMPEVEKMEFFEGTGRAVSLAQAGKQYGNLKAFYERTYGDLFCSEMTEAKRNARVDMLRQMLRETHKAQHGSYPDDATLEAELAKETICYDAYLIQAEDTPRSYWHYLLIYLVLALIIGWNSYTIVRWVRRHLLPAD